MTVRVEGVEFALDDAREFARRATLYSGGATRTTPTPGSALVVLLNHRIDEGGGSVTLTDEEARAAVAVLDEWRQKRERPDAVDALHAVLIARLGMSDGDV
jgi:hypothetical protein